ncbi:conserved hypothetical protein [Ricinus communis]|uniref:Uncharacterized protein n=1 Tax=Ricinus communis TaxID=3988 RepID=B9SU91_RICCO|nr:conserved hypothetical protein [Ricinus communis]
MARKGNPISVRLDLNRSSDSSRFSEGDCESHQKWASLFLCPILKKKRGRTLQMSGTDTTSSNVEDHRNIPGTRACRERSTLGGRASTVSPGHS